MAWRSGYAGEYKAKKELIEEYGEHGVIKIAIAQFGADFLAIKDGILDKAVEVKFTTQAKYYSSPKEKKQFARIKEFAEHHNCKSELWIYVSRGSGFPLEKEIRNI
mgnify:CR=1 FL=1|tara:strand:- start:185 stop:502 length:318 start_codon:yes stop_codon:yes gene_type:complete